MENLLALLDKIQRISPLPVFAQEKIIVQNAGMQHWLNMSLAQQRGISMNIEYALPAQFLWQLIRSLVSDEQVPEQSPYSREVLVWRIYQLLGSKDVIEDSDFSMTNSYWMPTDKEQANTGGYDLKRYQLSGELADLYEQYLIFRPEWINNWCKGQFNHQDFTSDDNQESAKWQGKLWYLLTQQQPYNPLELVEQAIANLPAKKAILPARLSFFGINIMAPMWLEFIHQLSEVVDVHFFHLNPCYAYWGDILSEKQAIKSINHWVDGHDDFSQSVGNPLLANLGQQGREFMALLQQYSTINVDVFESTLLDADEEKPTVLKSIQHDILSLNDARNNPQALKDDSIVIASAHSALREVQGLHDWLLHQFNHDKSLTPKDVIVMCPQVEQYAPFINAVFTRGWQDIDDKIPPLPCSIADRVSKDAEPAVAAFAELLTLPDSRFTVTSFTALLRLPAMQNKFSLVIEDIAKIEGWLEHAAIHWGIDQNHKQKVLGENTVSAQYTWQQGLSRLLQGFAYGDSAAIYQESLLLPYVEGNDSLLLGKLMLIIEQLQYYALQLSKPRSATQWHQFLLSLIETLFVVDDDIGFVIVNQAIESLVEYCQHAEFDDNISLDIIREFLNQHFSQPDPGRQFMVGQVTFCSMLPMRSIPFKVIAILGLNDGEFPRQRQPMSVDLMGQTSAKIGDRSRRGDDRYLFLEAIISARQSLYLSYQGRNIKNNKPRQPSLVLTELMEYLERGYQWQLLDNGNDNKQLPMQPFSKTNFIGALASFDQSWLALNENNQSEPQPLVVDSLQTEQLPNQQAASSLAISELVMFFVNPAKIFAQRQLHLFFDGAKEPLSDTEPFSVNRLQSYLLRQQLLEDQLVSSETDDKQTRIDKTLKQATLSGKFPNNPTIADEFSRLEQDSENFAHHLITSDIEHTKSIEITLELNQLNIELPPQWQQMSLTAKVEVANNKLVFIRNSAPKAKDFLQLYFHQLILQIWQEVYLNTDTTNAEHTILHNISETQGHYFDTKSQKVSVFRYHNLIDPIAQLANLLTFYQQGKTQALLLNAEIADVFFKAKTFEQAQFLKLWRDDNVMFSLGDDPYMNFFWPECPDFSLFQEQWQHCYLHYFSAREKVS